MQYQKTKQLNTKINTLERTKFYIFTHAVRANEIWQFDTQHKNIWIHMYQTVILEQAADNRQDHSNKQFHFYLNKLVIATATM